MKTEAYVCDSCGELKYAAEVVGVKPVQDLFDPLKSFPIDPHPHKQNIHMCTTCYNMKAVSPAERETNRRKDEHGYEMKLKEMAYILRNQCVTNYNKKVQKKIR